MTERIKPPFPYYGAKGNLAPWIASLLPEHDAYVEPFAGSAAVLLAKAQVRSEVLNDLDGNVVNFYRVLRDHTDDLIESLALTPYARDEYRAVRDAEPTGDPVERARRFFVSTAQGFSAKSRPTAGFSPTHPRKSGKAVTFARRIDGRLADVAVRLREVEIENVDALDLLSRWDRPGTAVYLDPPYLGSTRASSRDYATDNGGDNFHARLLSVLQNFQGAIALSGYRSDSYDALLGEGWTRTDREVYAPTSSTGNAGRRVECVWTNYEPPCDEQAA